MRSQSRRHWRCVLSKRPSCQPLRCLCRMVSPTRSDCLRCCLPPRIRKKGCAPLWQRSGLHLKGGSQVEEAVILAAVRTPIGRYAGALKDMRPDDLAALTIAEAISQSGVGGDQIEDVILG